MVAWSVTSLASALRCSILPSSSTHLSHMGGLLLDHQATQVHFGSGVGNNPAMRENGTPHPHAGTTTAAMVGSLPGLTSAPRFPHALQTKRDSRSESLTSSAHWSTTCRPRT